MADIFEIVGRVSLDGIDRANRELTNLADNGERSSSKLSKFGSIAKTVGKGVLVGTGTVVTGAVGLIKQVSSSYGALQQSVGGIETLFKDSAQKVITNANNAYKTAGMSANDYMQQVTSFSASLLQSLGGDTEKAADAADMAITDMSDNANKMGTSMEMITNAYQGFSKQNYTMLDNLKLGYGGTKSEMERLLADAQKISGVKYDISNLNDVYQAIHVIQGELGITGTTAKEAGETIEGSFGSLSASWQNFIAGLGNPSADMKALVDALANSLTGAVKNVIPVIDNMVQVLPTVVSSLVGAVKTMLPTLIETFTGIVTEIINAIVDVLPTAIPLIVDCVMTVVEAVLNNLPAIIDGVILLVSSLITKLSEMIPTLIPLIINVLSKILDSIVKNLPQIVKAVIALTKNIASALIKAIPQLLQAGLAFFRALIDCLPTIIDELVEALPSLIDAVVNTLIEALPQIIDASIALFMGIVKALPTIIDVLIRNLPAIINTIINALINAIPQIVQAGFKLFMGIVMSIPQMIGELLKPENLGKIGTTILNELGKLPQKVFEIGKNIIQGLIDGVKSMVGMVGDAIKQVGDWWLSGFRQIFNIHSPSRVMRDEIGKNLAEGIAVGITEDDSAENALNNKVNKILNVADYTTPNIRIGASVNDIMSADPMTEYQVNFTSQMNTLGDTFDRVLGILAEYLPIITEKANRDVIIDANSLAVGLSRQIDVQLGKMAVAKGRGNV